MSESQQRNFTEKDKSELLSHDKKHPLCQMYKISIIGIITLIFVYAISILARPTISPEIGLSFLLVDGVHDITQAFHKFIEFNETWYRPLPFYLTSFLIFQWIDIHNIFLVKLVAFYIILFNGFIVTELAKKIFDSSVVERIIIFALVISHPLYYNIAFEGSGTTDPIFNIFLNLFLICFLALLEDTDNKISTTSSKLNNRSKISLVILCCLLVFCTITSHERGLAIFPMIGILYAFYQWNNFTKKRIKFEISTTSVVIFSAFIFLVYIYFVYGSKHHDWTGEHYRTTLQLEYVIPNILKAIELPFRFLFYPMGRSYDAHFEFWFNFFAIPFIISLALFVVSICRSNNTIEKNRLKIITTLFICSLPIPVIFGGSPWHFFTASIYVSIITGRSISYWLQMLNNNQHAKSSALAVFFMWLIITTPRGISQELPREGNFIKFMLLMDKALNDKTITDVKFIPEVVYYDTEKWESNTWPFGGQGNLFKYVYNDSKIIEIALVNGKILESERPLCQKALGKKSLSFAFNSNNLSWRAIENKNYCDL